MKAQLLALLERAGSTAVATWLGFLTVGTLTSLSGESAATSAAVAAALSILVNGALALFRATTGSVWADAVVRVVLTYGQSFVALWAVQGHSWMGVKGAAAAALPALITAIKVGVLAHAVGNPALFARRQLAHTGHVVVHVHGVMSKDEVRDRVFGAHQPRSLGRRRPTRVRQTLRLATYLTGVVPAHPLAIDNTAHVAYGLDGNDQFGVCVPTGYDNYRRTTTANLTGSQVSASQADVYAWYRTQNPNFDPATDADDNGMDIQTFLEYLVKTGEILGFAAVDVQSASEVDAALFLFLGVLYGVDLQLAQQAQTTAGVWDYKRSGDWGGHCVVGVGYSEVGQVGQDVITWAEQVRMTPAFEAHQAQEAFVVIRPEHVAHPAFRAGVDLELLAADFKALTGKTFPVPVTPPPPPPAVATPADRDLWAQLKPWTLARHEGPNRVAALEVMAWARGLGME